jgi:hypothetical protein
MYCSCEVLTHFAVAHPSPWTGPTVAKPTDLVNRASREVAHLTTYRLPGKLSLKDWSFADCIDRLLPALEEFVRHADSAKLPATVGQEVQSLRMVTTNAPVMQILPGLPCPRHLAPSHAAVREDQPGAPGYNRPREGAVMQIRLSPDLREMIAIVKSPKTDLHAPIPHGDGQTILREAILIVDHTSYHVGEFAILRQVVNNWK